MRYGGSQNDDIPAMAVDLHACRELADRAEILLGVLNFGNQGAGAGNTFGKSVLRCSPRLAKFHRVTLVLEGALQDSHALGRAVDACDIYAKGETVQQLWTQLPLFRVHRADQNEASWVAERNALALDYVDSHGGGIQKQIHDMIVEQVDLVDIEQTAIGRGQDAGLEATLALFYRLFDI